MPRLKRQSAIHPFDIAYGTDTSGLIAGDVIVKGTGTKVEDLTAYYGIAPSIFDGLLDCWLQRTSPHPIERTVFLDVGAGKGRALLLASRHPFLRVEGVEINEELAQIAQGNIATWKAHAAISPLAEIAIFRADATKHPLPHAPTLAFLFHPFELPLLRRFLRHIEKSQAQHPQPFDLLYANAEHDSLLDRHPAFDKLWMGRIAMTPADHVADLAAIAEQKEYGSTGDELCAIYRFRGRANKSLSCGTKRSSTS